jgi:hypothetical protein
MTRALLALGLVAAALLAGCAQGVGNAVIHSIIVFVAYPIVRAALRRRWDRFVGLAIGFAIGGSIVASVLLLSWLGSMR